jgi:HEAT repeat protein
MFAVLEAGLDDPDEDVRRVCAWGLCHWDSMTAERVRVVLRRLGQSDGDIREFLAFAVCRSQAALPEVVAFLHGALRKERGGRPLRSAAAVALGRLGVEAALADLLALLDSGEEQAAEALCRLGPAALPGLAERLQQGSAKMRKLLLRAAADLQDRNPHLADLLPGVLSCLRHEQDEVRQAALRVLQGCKRRSAEGARLVEAMIWQERDRETRRDAVGVLARLSPHPQAAAATFAEVQRDRDAEVRAAVPWALDHLGLSPKVELELLRVALGDVAEGVRSAAVWRAGSLGPAAAPLLPDLLRILDGLNREDWCWTCVTRALAAMGPAAAPALEALRAEDSAGRR